MALLADINTQLVSLVSNALSAAGISNCQVGSEWPPKDILQNAGQDMTSVIAVLHKMTTYRSRNMRYQHSVTVNPVGVISTLSDFSIAPGQSVTLTLSASVNVGDLVSFVVSADNSTNAATFTAVSGATLNSMAAGLVTAINATFSTMSASASGAVITITNNDTIAYHVTTAVGNTTSISETVKWACRSMQINVWCGDLTTKFAIQAAIETLLAQLDDAEGFALTSTEWVQLKFHGAKPDDAETDKDIYCDFYLFTIDATVDVTQEYWPVAATIPTITSP